MKIEDNQILTVSDVVRFIAYEKELGIYIFLEENRLPSHKIKLLREERLRIQKKIKSL